MPLLNSRMHVSSSVAIEFGARLALGRLPPSVPVPVLCLVPSTTDSRHVPATSTENGPASTLSTRFPQTVAVSRPPVCGFARVTRALRRPVKRALLPSGRRSIPQLSCLWPASPRDPSSHLTSFSRAPLQSLSHVLLASDWIPCSKFAWYKHHLSGHARLAQVGAHQRAQCLAGRQ
jgi:hypothetical protein